MRLSDLMDVAQQREGWRARGVVLGPTADEREPEDEGQEAGDSQDGSEREHRESRLYREKEYRKER
jgi:hypothetical protein